MKPAAFRWLSSCLLLSGLVVAPRADAVPAFARREGVKCQMCHFRLPELNEDGHAYLRRGLRESPEEMMRSSSGGMEHKARPAPAPAAHDRKSSGGSMDHMKMASPMPADHGMKPSPATAKPAHPSSAMPVPPPAHDDRATETGMGGGRPAASAEHPLGEPLELAWQDYLSLTAHHSFVAPEHERAAFDAGEAELWLGGPLDPHWSALASMEFDIASGAVGVEQAYAQFNTSWSDRFASVRFGQLLPFAVLFNGGGAEMPISRPLILDVPARAEDPRVPTTFVRGVEAGYVDLERWNAYVGAGQPNLGVAPGEARTDVYASAEHLLGSQGSAVSGLAYRGSLAATTTTPSLEYERLLLFANGYSPHGKAVLGLLWGSDRPDRGASLAASGGFLLGELLVDERWAAYARYDHVRHERANTSDETTRGPTLGVSRWMQTQVRLTFETRYLRTTGEPRDLSANAQLLWAF